MKRRTIIIAGTVVALVVCVSAIAAIPSKKKRSGSSKKTETAQAENNTANVVVAPVALSDFTAAVILNGITTAKRDVTYAAESAGRLEYLGAEIGDFVRRGNVLARVDFSTQRAQHLQAQASYELAKTTHQRMETLGADLVSAQKLDEARANMQGAKASLALAEANKSRAVVRAEGRGDVAMKFAEEGEFVAPGTPLYRVVDTRTIVVEAAVPKTQINAVRTGARVSVKIDALGAAYTGTVAAIIPKADPASRTFTVRVEVKNPEGRILVGMSASVVIETETQKNIVMIPQELVIEGQADRYVYVVENGHAHRRTVVLGNAKDDKVMIQSGLALNDMLVTFGNRDLTDGQAVRVTPAPPAN